MRGRKPGTNPREWFSGIDDDAWLWMNTVGRRRSKAVAAIVPGVPDAEANGRWRYWGEAYISKRYVEKRWKEIFDVCEY